jgi:DNA adenine methylase
MKPSGARYPFRLVEQFRQLLQNEDADPALRYLFLNRCGWNGRVILNSDWRHRTYFSNPKGWSLTLLGRLADAAQTVADAKITCSDFEWLFDEPGEDVFIFADPPYMADTNFTKSSKLYECGFTLQDHTRLRDCASRCKHKWMISYDDDPVIHDLYKDFFIHPATWTYMGQKDRPKGRELIITNYPCSTTGLIPASAAPAIRPLAAAA